MQLFICYLLIVIIKNGKIEFVLSDGVDNIWDCSSL